MYLAYCRVSSKLEITSWQGNGRTEVISDVRIGDASFLFSSEGGHI